MGPYQVLPLRDLSGPGSDGNEGVLRIPRSFNIRWFRVIFRTEMQLYSTAPTDRAASFKTMIPGSISLPKRLGIRVNDRDESREKCQQNLTIFDSSLKSEGLRIKIYFGLHFRWRLSKCAPPTVFEQCLVFIISLILDRSPMLGLRNITKTLLFGP